MIPHLLRPAAAALALVALGTASAQVSPSAASATPPPAGPPADVAPAPAPTFTSGGDLRLRNEYLNNAFSLSAVAARHEQDYFRFRGRLWFADAFAPGWTLNARLAAEPRLWEKPAFVSQFTGTGREMRYGLLDNLNLKWTGAFGLPLTITIGRQDIQFGDSLNWWLVADGTPADGSWSLFFDSVRATLEAPEIKTRIDLIGINQHARPDAWLPILGHLGPYSVVEQNEQGAILYVSNKSLPSVQVDGYFIYKKDEKVFAAGDNANLYTLGAKLGGTPSPHWQYSIEGAGQWGKKQDPMVRNPVNVGTLTRDVCAWGGNARLTYLLKDPANNQLGLVAEYLSGDDPGTTGKDEMFDILWGRWPRFSELYITSYIMETGGKVAQLNNLLRLGGSWTTTPVKGTTFSVTYNAMFAPQHTPTRMLNAALFSQSGGHRGQLLQLVLKRQLTKNVSGHLWAEFFAQGDYYARRDTMTFLRAELMVTF